MGEVYDSENLRFAEPDGQNPDQDQRSSDELDTGRVLTCVPTATVAASSATCPVIARDVSATLRVATAPPSPPTGPGRVMTRRRVSNFG